jgi:hypothetical protein
MKKTLFGKLAYELLPTKNQTILDVDDVLKD